MARSFLSFQWDNLLLECGLLGALVSPNKRVPWVTFLLRVALFKLYFESGLAKYQSPIGDWKDGSAMAYYYETAPIPTWLAWYAHHLPRAWHALESHITLVFELGVPFLIFAPRPARLVAFGVFSGFQLLNIATANYGFFQLPRARPPGLLARAARSRASAHLVGTSLHPHQTLSRPPSPGEDPPNAAMVTPDERGSLLPKRTRYGSCFTSPSVPS